MSDTQNYVSALNAELQRRYSDNNPITVHVNNMRALASVASLYPLEYAKYPRRHRPRLVGDFALRAFLLSSLPTNARNDIWNAFPVIGEDNRMYLVSFGQQTQRMVNHASKLLGLIK